MEWDLRIVYYILWIIYLKYISWILNEYIMDKNNYTNSHNNLSSNLVNHNLDNNY